MPPSGELAAQAWTILRAATAAAGKGGSWQDPQGWLVGGGDQLRPAAVAPAEARALLELYLPLCKARAGRPLTLAHLGQSLDGCIATSSGDSYYVTGPDNVRHLHRLRALSQAVVVGAGTVARDDPQLTVRHVEGANPGPVVLDP